MNKFIFIVISAFIHSFCFSSEQSSVNQDVEPSYLDAKEKPSFAKVKTENKNYTLPFF